MRIFSRIRNSGWDILTIFRDFPHEWNQCLKHINTDLFQLSLLTNSVWPSHPCHSKLRNVGSWNGISNSYIFTRLEHVNNMICTCNTYQSVKLFKYIALCSLVAEGSALQGCTDFSNALSLKWLRIDRSSTWVEQTSCSISLISGIKAPWTERTSATVTTRKQSNLCKRVRNSQRAAPN
jgi:hypothetical protein